MMSNTIHGDDRENLSALFDGELDGDAARFALKRLGHDAQWRQACGRWQLCGDVLRGRAQGVAPADFADRVAAAIAADAAIQRSRESAAPADAIRERPRSRRGWFGGAALAASVAVAALFVARPFSDDAAGGSADPVQVTVPALAAAQPQPATPAAVDPAATASGVPAATSGDASVLAGGAAATAVAVAELPRRLNERRSRGQSQRAALRASAGRQAEAPVQVAAIGGASPLPADAARNPFHPPQNETPAARPWPRAVLPNFPADHGYTASYGSSGSLSPSFYPFEPAAATDEPRVRAPAPERSPQP